MQNFNLIAKSVLKLSHCKKVHDDDDDDNDDDDDRPALWSGRSRVRDRVVADLKNCTHWLLGTLPSRRECRGEGEGEGGQNVIIVLPTAAGSQ